MIPYLSDEDLKNLERLTKTARKLGLRSFRVGELTLILGESPSKRTRTPPGQPKTVEEQQPEYTEDQLIGWSVYGED